MLSDLFPSTFSHTFIVWKAPLHKHQIDLVSTKSHQEPKEFLGCRNRCSNVLVVNDFLSSLWCLIPRSVGSRSLIIVCRLFCRRNDSGRKFPSSYSNIQRFKHFEYALYAHSMLVAADFCIVFRSFAQEKVHMHITTANTSIGSSKS